MVRQMRVIFNLVSNRLALAAGWRAKALVLEKRDEATVEDGLRAARLDVGTLYDLVAAGGLLKEGLKIYVNGAPYRAGSSLDIPLKDNSQIYIVDGDP